MGDAWIAQCEEAASLVAGARKAVAFTGAGISVPSGIPDFRSPGGLWSRFDPMEVASIQALATNPRGVWEFLLDAHKMFRSAEPNPAHTALASMERDGIIAGVITQNIDRLHQRAGSANVVEFHGSSAEYYCRKCRLGYEADRIEELAAQALPVTCDCGGVVRPTVVFFGEGIPAAAQRGSEELLSGCDCIVIVGTSGDVAPANQLPHMVKARGGAVVEVNLGRTAYASLSDVRIDAPAEKVLPILYDLAIS